MTLWLAVIGTMACAQPELPKLDSRGKLAIHAVTPSATEVERHGLVELTVDLSATYDNPYNPRQISVQATFTPPSRWSTQALGFFYQPYSIRGEYSDDNAPLLDEDGPPRWLIRFTLTEVGEWRYHVTARDSSGEVTSRGQRITVVNAEHPGFIGVSGRNPRYFEFEDGSPFVPIGHNLQNDWPVYRHSRLLADGGGNAARPWTFCHWTWLEWTYREDTQWAGPGHYMRSYGGAGVYNQRIAWIADHHLRQWERDGLHVMLCLGNGNQVGGEDRYDMWGGHPYSIANGGFLERGPDFWTDQQARIAYRDRLRYIVARYGYSPNVWAWELWNELGRETDEIVAWTDEMSAYLHALDPNHLVTTSHWGTNAEASPRTWAVPGIDFTQSHNYFGVETIRSRTAELLAISPKPHVIGEGGGTNPGPDGASDPTGIDFHNSLWASLFSGAAGPTLSWWWRERIEPNDRFGEYAAISRFVERIDWLGESWVPIVDEIPVSVADAGALSPVLIVPLGPGWGPKPERGEFTVQPDGAVDGLDELGPVLYGTDRADWANPPTFLVEYPSDGRFIVRPSETAHGILEIELDGETIARDDRYDVDRQYFTEDVAIDIPTGAHRITIRNAGTDWLRIGHILLTDYRHTSEHPDVDVLGLRSETSVALWIRHRLNEWPYRALGYEPRELSDIDITVPNVADGRYRVEWWSTADGTMRRGAVVGAAGGEVTVRQDGLTADTACVLRLIGGNRR